MLTGITGNRESRCNRFQTLPNSMVTATPKGRTSFPRELRVCRNAQIDAEKGGHQAT